MKKLTPQQIAAEIRQHFPHFAAARFSSDAAIFGSAKTGAKIVNGPDTRVGSDVLHDYCQIGALLTDDVVCHKHLNALDRALRIELSLSTRQVPVLKVVAPGSVPPGMNLPNNKDPNRDQVIQNMATEFIRWRESPDGKGYAMKFNGALQRVLQRQEDRFGFNGAEFDDEDAPKPGDVKTPGKTPVLTGFVKAPEFTKHLLKQKRHWKDPGARLTHGEFTHRLQWWIVMQEKAGGANYQIRGDLGKRFAQLVKYPYHPTGVNGPADADGRIMWDFLFDCFTNAPPKSSDSYRTPDNLHDKVMNGVGGSLLQAVIVARNNKRVIMNKGIGGKALDDYEAWKCRNGTYVEIRDDSQVVKFIVNRA